jgi:hypothetical protein
MKRILFLALMASALFSSCKKESNEKIFKGPVTPFQHGKAWTWYETDDNNKPLRLAVAIDEAAMSSLDRGTDNGGHQHHNSVVLKFHPKAATVFNHVDLGWNPHGHEPEFIYGLPHFDFHFYTITPEAVAAIPPYEVDSSKHKNWPASDYFPATYFNPGGGVPKMGVHWLDFTSPELNGATFTQTFIYGSYDGQVTFYEPMITEAFILANPAFERAIPQPAKVQKTGYYPTKMRIAKISGITNIILEGFVLRQAS